MMLSVLNMSSENDRRSAPEIAIETVVQFHSLQVASLPVLGQVYAWMPLKPHASTPVRVIAVTWIDGQFWVQAVDLRHTTRAVRKPLSVWLTSTVLLDDDLARAAEASALP
jgi:hypothetical protein